jgi:anti-anti-sigma factor
MGGQGLVFEAGPGVLSVSGEIDASNSEVLLDRICQESRNGPFVLDLLDVGFMDSAGIQALLMAAHRMEDRGPLRIKPSPAILRLFEITRLDAVPGIEVVNGSAGQPGS